MLPVCMYMHIHNVKMRYESQLPSVWQYAFSCCI